MSQGLAISHSARPVIWLCGGLVVLGIGALAAGLSQDAERVWSNLLLVSYGGLSVGLGALVFLALQYVTGAHWSMSLRRVPEAMVAFIALGALGLGVVFLARPSLYPWAAEASPGAASSPMQAVWFEPWFFLVRAAIYVAVWLVLGIALVRRSQRQVEGSRPVGLSAGFLVVFAVTFFLASYDWLMSLEPDWYSTIFAVYQFGGMFLGSLAVIILLAACLYWGGPFRQVLGRGQVHDLGKLLFGFSTFWMYLWFCQYMLIWYTDNPEETVYFTRRVEGSWGPLLVVALVLNWGIPFLVLLPRATKERVGILAAVAGVVLAGRWLDMYVGILPYAGEPEPAGLAWEVGLVVGAVGLFGLMFFAVLGKTAPARSMTPSR
jgi:hypothetical protein